MPSNPLHVFLMRSLASEVSLGHGVCFIIHMMTPLISWISEWERKKKKKKGCQKTTEVIFTHLHV